MSTTRQKNKASAQYWILAFFLMILLATGGASRIDVQSLVLLRPLSVIVCALACMTLRRAHFVDRAWLLGWAGAIFLLPLLHLIPLPPLIWQSLAGRQDLIDVEKLAGLSDIWRPLTLAPMNGWHALLSLFVPLAVVLLGIQLNRDDLFRLLPLLIALAALSGLLGLLQVIGDPQSSLYFYRITNNGSAVGLFANRNHAATLLACLFPMLAVYAATARGEADGVRMRLLVATAIAIVLVPLVLVTGSRSGLVGAVVGLVAAALLYGQATDARSVRRRRSERIKSLPILIGVAVISLALLTYLLSRAEAIERLLIETSDGDERTDFWAVSIDLFWKYFPWGSGSGSYVEAFQLVEPTRLLDATYLNRAHNDWVETAVTFGLPGFLTLTAAVIAYGIRSYRLWRSADGSKRSVAFGRLASVMIAMIAIASASDYPLRTPTMMGLFAIYALWLTEAGRSRTSIAVVRQGSLTIARASKLNLIIARLRNVGLVRIAFCTLIGLVGAWFSLALAISGVTRIKAPQAALSFIPSESTALASQADQLFFASPKDPPPAVSQLAMNALEKQAINAKALRILGYAADARGDGVQAERFVRMAARLSRREPGAQLWLIEASARNGDVAQTLVHYDIALRTKPDTQTILFPRLLNAIEDREIRAALKPYIRGKNDWAPAFLYFANANSKNLPVLVDLIIETGGLADEESAKRQELGLLDRLVAESYFAEARRLYLQMPGAKPVRLTSAAFDASDRDARFGPMGWQLLEGPDAGGGFTGSGSDQQTRLAIYANSATTRPVASKLLYLKPGKYLFSARLANLDRGDDGFLRWQLRCPAIGSTAAWTIDSINASLRAELLVPANCPVQFLDLIASGGKGQTGLEATIASVSLAPAN